MQKLMRGTVFFFLAVPGEAGGGRTSLFPSSSDESSEKSEKSVLVVNLYEKSEKSVYSKLDCEYSSLSDTLFNSRLFLNNISLIAIFSFFFIFFPTKKFLLLSHVFLIFLLISLFLSAIFSNINNLF